MSTRAKAGISKPNTKYLYNLKLNKQSEPRTITQALADEK